MGRRGQPEAQTGGSRREKGGLRCSTTSNLPLFFPKGEGHLLRLGEKIYEEGLRRALDSEGEGDHTKRGPRHKAAKGTLGGENCEILGKKS